MIRRTKSMIAGCIDKLSHDSCGSCERRDACASLFSRLFGSAAPRVRREPSAQLPFLAFLGRVARRLGEATNQAPPVSAFCREVEARIEPLLALGEMRIERVARELGLSRQTLYRRLKAEGTTFEALLDGVRRRLAVAMIRKDRLPVKDAAWRLGFSDPAAFSRAYKRWTGASPAAARR